MADLYRIAHLCNQLDMNARAEAMYVPVLQGYENAWGQEHTSTLHAVNNLEHLYADRDKMAVAEVMYVRALRGYAKAIGTDHPRTRMMI